jgi:hypothetical protein
MSDKNQTNEKVSFTEAEIRFIKKLDEQRLKAENRFPLVTALFVTFGLVAVLYGFEKLIDRISFFVNYPYVLLVIGLVILWLTGTVYKKLN